jgi:5'-nucleotidase
VRSTPHDGISRRFPAISGLRVSWDSRKPGGQRVLGVWLLAESKQIGADGKPILVDKEEVLRTSTRKYLIMCGEYMVQGGDGYDVLKGKKLVITAENGQSKGALIRKFLLGEFSSYFRAKYILTVVSAGAQFLNQELEKKPEARSAFQSKTLDILGGVESQLQKLPRLPNLPQAKPVSLRSLPKLGLGSVLSSVHGQVHSTAQKGIDAVAPAVKLFTSQRLFLSAALAVAEHEDMGFLDSYERQRARIMARRRRSAAPPTAGIQMGTMFAASRKAATSDADQEEARIDAAEVDAKKNLPVIHPVVDGRLKDVARG